MYHENLIKNIIKNISEYKEKIHAINDSEPEKIKQAYDNNAYCSSYFMPGRDYHFLPEALEKWETLVQQISKEVFKDRFSLTYINKGLRKYFHENYEDYNPENLNKFLSELKENASDTLFYIPLYGLQLSNKELNIGNFSLKTIEKIKEEISEIEPKLNLEIAIDVDISPNQVFLINKYQTDSEKALDITLTQTKRLVDILNWSFSKLTPPSTEIKHIISLQQPRNRLEYFSLNNKENITGKRKNISSVSPLDLNADIVQRHICNNELSWLIELISQEGIDDYHDAILRSIHWFSQFWIEQQSDNKLLYLAISLESLLSEKSSTNLFISDRIAFILGENQASRLRLIGLSKKLYDLRSGIAHGSKINIVKEQELNELETISRKIIQYALDNRNNFKSLKDFKKSIDDKKYQ